MKKAQPLRLAVLLPDPLKAYVAKGEIKARYYNPCGLFKEVHFISFCDEVISVGSVQETVGSAQLAIHPVGFVGPWTFPARRNRVLRVLKAIQPDVIRSYNPLIAGWFAVQAGRALGCPVVLSLHNDFDLQRAVERRPVLLAQRFLERWCIERADAVICMTESLVPYARDLGAREVAVIYNRVHTDKFFPSEEVPAIPPLRILSVSRLVRQKAPDVLMRAFAHLPDARLTLIGDGPRREEIEGLAKALGAWERVKFIPAIPNRDIPQFYREANCLAIATHFEGFCIPVLEAMASGLPVVASDLPPIREIVGDAGLVVPTTPVAFAGALKRIQDDSGLREELSKAARRRAEVLSGDLMEEREAALYRFILGIDKSAEAKSSLWVKTPLWSHKQHVDYLVRGRARHLHRVRSTFLVEQVQALRASAGGPLTILDLGCGDGIITNLLRRALPSDVWISGLDFDLQRLHRATEACPDIAFQAADATALPVTSNSVDCLVAHHIVEHVSNDVDLIEECYRVLRPGGICLLGIPQEDSLIGRVLRKCHPRLYRGSEHIHYYSKDSMRALLEAAGFFVDRVAPFGLLFPNYYVHYMLLGARSAFAVGHWLAQKWDALADSLIFVALKHELQSQP
jgi:glycosyltransferase involved in cell wall biosynthesis/SAM-dependent methyltransferase